MMLRPIGTTFDITFPPSLTSAETAYTTITYKVVAHVRALRFIGDPVGFVGESVTPIEIKKRQVEGLVTMEEMRTGDTQYR